jgi:putative transposase
MTNTSTTYHVWFATKRRKWLPQGDIDQTVNGLIRQAARAKGISLLECGTAVDHVHLLLRLRPDQTLPRVMNLLKGISSRRLHAAFPELKLDSHSDHFWQRGYNFTVVQPGSLTSRRRYVQTQQERLEKFERP